MQGKFWFGVIAAAVALGGTMTSALAASLNVKTGLWEMNLQMEMNGQLPIPPEVLQQMSPERRAAMEKAIQGMSNKPQTTAYKSCVTQQDLDKGDKAFLQDEPGVKCDVKMSRHSGTAVAGTFNCAKGSLRQSGDFSYEAKDREHIAGKVKVSMSNGGNTMTTQGNMTGRWIGASCGDVQ